LGASGESRSRGTGRPVQRPGALYTCRPELVGFVNGLPLVVIELKKSGVPARAAFDENLTHYKSDSTPHPKPAPPAPLPSDGRG